jgi:dTMP kinase
MKLIIFEGIDGCGKSTQAKKLYQHLSKTNSVVLLREPGGIKLSEKIRNLLLDVTHDIDPLTEVLLFSASRNELLKSKILPELNKGKIVILDRFIDSTIAYQGYGRGVDIKKIREISDFVFDADLYKGISGKKILIDIDVRTAMNRLGIIKDRIELFGEHFYSKVRNGYLEIASNEEYIIIDGSKSEEEIHQEVLMNIL